MTNTNTKKKRGKPVIAYTLFCSSHNAFMMIKDNFYDVSVFLFGVGQP